MSHVNYRLDLPTQWSIHPVFHIDLLTPYRETVTHGPNYQRPPPELVDSTEEFEIEKILDSRRFGWGRRLQYLVKWKGYPDSENQWVNKEDAHADEAIAEYHASISARGVHIRRAICNDELSSHSPSYMSSTTAVSRPSTPVTSTINSPFIGPYNDEPVLLIHPYCTTVEDDSDHGALCAEEGGGDTMDIPPVGRINDGRFDEVIRQLLVHVAGRAALATPSDTATDQPPTFDETFHAQAVTALLFANQNFTKLHAAPRSSPSASP